MSDEKNNEKNIYYLNNLLTKSRTNKKTKTIKTFRRDSQQMTYIKFNLRRVSRIGYGLNSCRLSL